MLNESSIHVSGYTLFQQRLEQELSKLSETLKRLYNPKTTRILTKAP